MSSLLITNASTYIIKINKHHNLELVKQYLNRIQMFGSEDCLQLYSVR